MRRRTAWIIAAAVATIVILVLGLPAWLANGTIRPKAATALSQKLDRDVQIGHLSLSVIRGRIRAANVLIADAPGFGSKPFATVQDVDVHLSWWGLLHGEFDASSVAVDGVQLRLVRNQHGVWNIASLPPLSMSLQPRIAQFSLRNAGITLAGPGRSSTRARLALEARNVQLSQAFPLQFDAVVDGNQVRGDGSLGPLDHDIHKAPVQMSISAARLSAPELARTVAAVGYRPEGFAIASGAVNVKAQIAGTLANLTIAAQVSASGVHLQQVDLGGSEFAQLGMSGGTGNVNVSRLDAALGYSGSAFRLSRLHAATNFGKVGAHGHIAPSGRLQFLLDLHLSAAPHKGGLSGLVGALVRIFAKAKDPELKLEVYGTTRQASVRQVQ